jgi:hypothetical protein
MYYESVTIGNIVLLLEKNLGSIFEVVHLKVAQPC